MLQLLELGTGPGAGSQQLRFPICLGQGDGDVPMLTASQRHVWFLGSRIVYVVNSLCHDLFFFFFKHRFWTRTDRVPYHLQTTHFSLIHSLVLENLHGAGTILVAKDTAVAFCLFSIFFFF